MATTDTQQGKDHKKLLKLFVGNDSRPRPVLVAVIVVLFAVVGGKALFNAFAASDSLYLAPASGTQSIGSNFTVVVHENSGTDAVNAVEADLDYDQAKLQFVSIDTTSSAFDLSAINSGGSGTVKMARAKSNTSLTGDQIVAAVTFKAIAAGSAAITFENSSALVLASNATNVLSNTSSGTYTIADTTAPGIPSALTNTSRTINSIAFGWTAPTDNVGVTGYKVYRGGSLVNGNVATTSFTDSGLTPNTSYSYTVAAFDAAGNLSTQSTALVVSTLPDTQAPTVPTNLAASARTLTSVTLGWTASTDNVAVTGYKIFRNGGVSPITTTNGSATSYTDSGLTPGTSYSYTILAVDGVGNASAQSSALATSTVADTTAPGVPTNLTSPSQTNTTINLSWTAPTDNVGVIGYNIFRNSVKVGTSPTNSYTDTSLTQGTNYTYTISAYDAASNTSAVSTAATFKTKTKPGDINGDGKVDALDFAILASHFGQTGQTYATGDLDNSGTINILDLSILASYWGT